MGKTKMNIGIFIIITSIIINLLLEYEYITLLQLLQQGNFSCFSGKKTP
jgi:hypothetical protein